MSTTSEYFETLRGRSIAVIGMGVSNTPLIRMLLRAELKVTVCDKSPRERVEAAADEMTYAYRKTKGERVVTEGGVDTIKELYARGYTLGIVSDLVGTEEVDEWLDRDGLRPYFKTVQQSSTCLIRKPHPAIYYYALEECGADPHRTCYVGDNLARDIVGAKAAGLGMTIGVQYPGRKPQEITDENRPDRFISHFTQLLDIFPPIE